MAVALSNLTAQWANTSIDYTAIEMDANSTGHGANTKLLDLKVNSVSQMSVTANGMINVNTIKASTYIGLNLTPVFAQANVAYDRANTAYIHANNAYNQANTAYNKANNFVMSTMTADFTTTSETAQNITGLSFEIGASETWNFWVFGYYDQGSDADTLRVQVTGPASPTSVSLNFDSIKNDGTIVTTSGTTSFASNMSSDAGAAAAGTFILTGTIVNGVNAGTIQVKGSTNNNPNDVIVYRTVLFAWRE